MAKGCRFIVLLLCGLAATCLLAPQAHASAASTGIDYCHDLLWPSPPPAKSAYIGPVVQCFTNPTQGVIPTITKAFMENVKTYYLPIVQAMLILMVMFFGIKMMTGHVQHLNAEVFMLLFKMAGVLYFIDQAPNLYQDMINIMQGLGDAISQASTSLNGAGFCNNSTGAGGTMVANDLWSRWDCIFGYIFVFSTVAMTGGLISFIVLLFFTAGTGIVIFFVALYLCMALIFAAARFIHVFLISVLGLSFMFCIGYLFVPLLLFKGSMPYFQKWLNVCISYILTPIIMMGLMGMMLVATDVAMFSGDYSVWKSISPSATMNGNAFDDVTKKKVDSFKSMFHVGFGNGLTDSSTSTGEKGCPPKGTPLANTTGSGGGTVSAGTLGSVADRGVLGSTFDCQTHPFMSKAGFNMKGIDLASAAAAAGKSEGNYIVDILVSFCSAALLAYIMYAMIGYIPDFASDLATSGSAGSAGKLGKSAVFGEVAARRAAEMTEKAVKAYLTGGASLKAEAAKMAAEKLEKKGGGDDEKMAGNRDK